MSLVNVSIYGYSSIDKIQIVTEALYKEKGLIDQWKRGNKRAGVKARKVFQLLRQFSKDARAEISEENAKRHKENKEKYAKRQALKKEMNSYDD